MKVDNQRNTYRIWIRRLILTILFTLLILLILFLPWFEVADMWLSKYHLIIAVGMIYIVISLVNYLKNPNFVSFSDQGEKIVMRYYPVSIFNSRKHSIEIPKKQFVKFELQDFLMGSQQKIILYQNFRNKVAKYPPISLSALDKEDREKIIQSLSKYITS
ncbi:MAG: hypothetical protein KAR19_03100 [Bacteroidales bacterium]|nr:hypothetical protein [Bacteroidales bacterium]